MKKNTQRLLVLAKVVVVSGILSYLIVSKKLDLSSLRIYLDDSLLLLVNCAVWSLGCLLLTSYRWHMLLKGMKIELPFKKIAHLNAVGFFFNTIAPGAVGGDLVKAYYLFRDQEGGKRTPALLAIFLDRLIGLYCVFLIASLAISSSYSNFMKTKMLTSIALLALLGFIGMTSVFLLLFFTSKPIESNRIFRFLQKPYLGFSFLQKIFLSLFMLKEKPLYFFKAILAGTLYQILYMSLFAFITVRMGHVFSLPDFAAIFPVGFLAAALPIAPGGLGVGHLAFDQLFALIGISDGANIYNCVFLGQSVLNLLGLIPYMLLKKDIKHVPTKYSSCNSQS